jgi:hypothetical protein
LLPPRQPEVKYSCNTYPLTKNEMFWPLEPTAIGTPRTKAPLGKDTFWIDAKIGCGWHSPFTKTEKRKTARNAGKKPTGCPISTFDVDGYNVIDIQKLSVAGVRRYHNQQPLSVRRSSL